MRSRSRKHTVAASDRGRAPRASLDRLPKSQLRSRVMLLDAVRAAAWSGYRYFHDWQELDAADQAYLIAAYQLDQEIQALIQHEAAEAAKKAARRGAPR